MLTGIRFDVQGNLPNPHLNESVKQQPSQPQPQQPQESISSGGRSMISGAHHALQGIQDNIKLFEPALYKIADPDSIAGPNDIIEMKQAQQAVAINIAALQKSNEVTGRFFDILA